MKTYKMLLEESRKSIKEIFPWDLREMLDAGEDLLIVDVREPYEYSAMHIRDSITVPRGILESACDWGYEDTVPLLASARNRRVIVVCRSGNRSIFAAEVMASMGYRDVYSLKSGIRGWNDSEEPLLDGNGNIVPIERCDEFLNRKPSKEQLGGER
jgi:rhodanese-related sulfurtransferase